MEQVSGTTTRQLQAVGAAHATPVKAAHCTSTHVRTAGHGLGQVIRSFALLTTVFGLLALAGMTAAQAAQVALKVVSARAEAKALGGTGVVKGAAVGSYKYLINVDNTGMTTTRSPTGACSPTLANGTANPDYPAKCEWTSVGGTKGYSPIFTQGTQADFTSTTMNIPDGRYLISVLADGYKLDGRHFTVSGASVTWEGKRTTDPANEVLVELQPTPLPDAQIQSAVFEDISPVNSAPDLPAEHGLAGFQGHILDYLGEVTTNVYGDPLCSRYDASGTVIAGSGGRCLSKCYVVDGGKDIGTVKPMGWSNPNTPSASGFGRCPIPVIDDETGVITPAITMYDLDGNSLSTCTGRRCPPPPVVPSTAAIEGKIKIPNLGPNRYTLSVTPPDGSGFIQTTTLEGNHDWDAWVMEGATGLDTEFTIGGEPFPAIIFGYIPTPGTPSASGSALPTSLSGTASITGTVEAVKIYVPTTGGVGGLPGEIWGGLQGAKIDKPIENPWVTLTDLSNGDTIVWAGQGDANGKFTIPNVPAGTYTLTWWDEPQNQILDLVNVTVAAGEHVDMGILPLSGWWTFFDGYVFDDVNRNGIKDPGEPGLPGYTLTMRKRENSLMDRGTTVVTTDADGYYKFEAGYPMTQWLVMEAYDDLHYTTGVTYQADNQPTPTTVIGAGVDVSVHPIIGLSGRLDWGKHTYDAAGANGIDPSNGGIVGTVSYDTTRNETNPRFAAVEDWQPSIPDLTVNLYAPVAVTAPGCIRQPLPNATCDSTGRYQVNADGSLVKGNLLNTYVTETWQQPKGCVARGMDGTPLRHGIDEQLLPHDDSHECIEAPLMGLQYAPYATDQGTADANFGAAVNGNYGFGDGCFATGTVPGTLVPGVFTPSTDPITGADTSGCTVGNLLPLPGGRDYLVHVVIPTEADVFGPNAAHPSRPIYKVTREEDINIGNGDDFVPAVPPSACAGALHTVDVKGLGTDLVDPPPTDNPSFVGIGGSPYEGLSKPLCDTKLVTLSQGKSVAPAFNLYTDVPIPGRLWFIMIDDLNFSSNPKSVTYGEKAGIPFAPVGIYDYTNRLIKTIETDYNGLADVLLPSTNRINCPTPSGVCANLYRFVGNDPGVPGRLNPNYNPSFRTIAAEFESLPGLIVPSDLAPTQVGVTVQLPGGQTSSPVMCMVNDPTTPVAERTPELFAVDRPYATRPNNGSVSVTIKGFGFGATKGSGQVSLSTLSSAPTTITLSTTSWSDTQIVASITSSTPIGPQQLKITSANGKSTVNGLTFHVLGGNGNSAYNPQLYEVGPVGSPFTAPNSRRFTPAETLPLAANHAIQNALDAAASYVGGGSNRTALVLVYPNTPTNDNPRQNPRGAYYENLIITAGVKLQGVGPGSPDGSVQGTIIDGGAFAGDSPVATDWYTRIGQETTVDANGNATPTWGGNATIYDGAVISIYVPTDTGGSQASRRRAFPTSYSANTAPSIDGFDLRGGDQQGFPGNINAIGGAPTGQPGGLITQGGAIFANAYARNLQITNNVVQNNGGAYGTIRIGNPDQANNENDGVQIANNRVIANAGTNLAGGIGLFAGADNYTIANNDICGNFSAEYGGGITVMGLQRNPTGNNYNVSNLIHDNRIYFNRSYDEGGGIMIAGTLPANTTTLSPGAGPVDIYNNLIQANLANDDGGGVRFLMASSNCGTSNNSYQACPINVYNNFIVNNISTHEGGGIALNDAPNVRVYNNTVMKNLTTATAVTSNGKPAPAGLSTSVNSTLLQNRLPAGSPTFSNPLLFNNIFWDNRAGTRDGSSVTGLGNLADCTGCDNWDLGVADGPALLAPTNSVIQQSATGAHPYTDPTTGTTRNWHVDPGVLDATYNVGVTFNAWRNNPAFLGAIMISADLPPNLMGNYHLATGSPAINLAANSKSGVNAPTFDIDNQTRPNNNKDAGADEYSAPVAAVAGVAPTTLAFGNVTVGSTSSSQTMTLSNTGTLQMTGIGVTVSAPFTRPSGNAGGTCGVTLNASSSCTINVVFAPTAAGAATGSVAINASVPVTGSPVSLSGTGIAAPGTVAFTGGSGTGSLIGPLLAFGNQTGPVSNTVTLTIGGGSAVTFGTATVANSNLTAFSKGADTCSGTTRAVGATCTITVNFNAPSTNNFFNPNLGALTVPHNGSGNPATLTLSGR